MLETYFTGAALGAGLIIAIGAQNAFILSLGLKRLHAIKAALVCAVADALLILAGVAGLGRLIASNNLATNIAALGGAAFLIAYAFFALKRALKPAALEAQETQKLHGQPFWPRPWRSRSSIPMFISTRSCCSDQSVLSTATRHAQSLQPVL